MSSYTTRLTARHAQAMLDDDTNSIRRLSLMDRAALRSIASGTHVVVPAADAIQNRERFETWYRGRYKHGPLTLQSKDGWTYVGITQERYEGWQAALMCARQDHSAIDASLGRWDRNNPGTVCVWVEDFEGQWRSESCGMVGWCFPDGGRASDHGMIFCHHCGHPLSDVPFESDAALAAAEGKERG